MIYKIFIVIAVLVMLVVVFRVAYYVLERNPFDWDKG